jgi:hypothetical protein
MAERLRVVTSRTVGRDEAHRLLLVADEAGRQRQVIWWDGGSQEPPEGAFDLAYVARAASYRGARQVQVELVAVRASPGALEVKAQTQVEVMDYRTAAAPQQVLVELSLGGDLVIWCEGEAGADVAGAGPSGHDRRALPHAGSLAIWTIPPGPAELREALARVRPTRICLFATDPGSDQPERFLRRLAGLVKHVLSARDGQASPAALAAATAQREVAVRLGLAWLAAQGHIAIAEEIGEELRLMAGAGVPGPESERIVAAARLKAALDESAAYRAFYRSADKDALVRAYKPGSH